MCGIWLFASSDKNITSKQAKHIVSKLFALSESRGKEASGIAGLCGSDIYLYKAAMSGSNLVRTSNFEKNWSNIKPDQQNNFMYLGHSRLVTNGSETSGDNNQPVYSDNIVTVHNGVIVNEDELWDNHSDLQREHEVDTEIFVKIFEKYINEEELIDRALSKTYSEIKGMATTISLLCLQNIIVAATNNGSLYCCESKNKKSLLIASESLILSKLIQQCCLNSIFNTHHIRQIKAGQSLYINLDNMKKFQSDLSNFKGIKGNTKGISRTIHCQNEKVKMKKTMLDSINILDENRLLKYEIDTRPIKKLRRCTRCVLPETMPFIEFDDRGVCNYCRTYKKIQYKGHKELEGYANSLKKKNGRDSLISFSGGRDSSYGMHYFVKELGLKPIAYSYDWGMVTDLARRNQSRMCEKLGVELIVVSADIRKKRENIRKNVSAWLKKPDIGMIPLFMAGDKQYFYYANKVKKDYRLKTVLLATNPFERTYFKTGYCGVKPEILRTGEEKRAIERLPLDSILRMTQHYVGQYVNNPSYINKSIWDTIKATISFYIVPHNYFRLYDYIPWDEKEVNKVLIDEYNWELAEDTKSTWRIGDGTAPFYNYVYYLVTGFSENDTLRSNQIREGMMTREEAMELVYEDNGPRFDSIKWYFDAIGLSMYDALEVVSKIPRRY